jgi:hypothetical protein
MPQTFDPIGRQVGVTARAMRVLLDGAMAAAGSTFSDWTMLATLAGARPDRRTRSHPARRRQARR